MLEQAHYSEQAAIDHVANIQMNSDTFAMMYEQCVGKWVVVYDTHGTPVDREALKIEQAIV